MPTLSPPPSNATMPVLRMNSMLPPMSPIREPQTRSGRFINASEVSLYIELQLRAFVTESQHCRL